MPKSKSVNISLEEYNRLKEVEKVVDGLHSALAKVDENYNLLLDEFKIATEKYRSTDEPSVKREAWWTLLVAIKDFLGKMPHPNRAAINIITELLDCLGDVHSGRTSPLLKPADKKPDRTNTNTYLADQGIGVALLEILHDERQGLPLSMAATKAVRLLEKYGANSPKQIGTEKANKSISGSLINFRKKMKSARDDSPKYDVAKRLYRAVMAIYGLYLNDPEHNKKDAVERTIEFVLPRRMGKKVQSDPS